MAESDAERTLRRKLSGIREILEEDAVPTEGHWAQWGDDYGDAWLNWIEALKMLSDPDDALEKVSKNERGQFPRLLSRGW